MPAKSLELLSYLLIHPRQSHNREILAETLWPDESASSSKRNLRQALWRLNAVSQDASGREAVDSAKAGWVQVNPAAFSGIDLDEFNRLHRSTRDLATESLGATGGAALERATALYRGELMTGWPGEWCRPERARAEHAQLAMLEQLVGHYRLEGHYAKGVAAAQVILERDPLRESAHREVMMLHHEAGDRPAAIRQYQLCVEALSAEFGIRPSAPTQHLYRQICADEAEPARPVRDVLPLARREGDSYATLHSRLDEIQASLQELRALMSRDHRSVG